MEACSKFCLDFYTYTKAPCLEPRQGAFFQGIQFYATDTQEQDFGKNLLGTPLAAQAQLTASPVRLDVKVTVYGDVRSEEMLELRVMVTVQAGGVPANTTPVTYLPVDDAAEPPGSQELLSPIANATLDLKPSPIENASLTLDLAV